MAGGYEPVPENPQVTWHFTNQELFYELSQHCISTASVNTVSGPWSDYNDTGIAHPDIDLLFIRPTSMAYIWTEEGCNGHTYHMFPEYDAEEYSRWLLREFGHLSKTVVLTDWEAEWILRRPACGCDESQAIERANYIKTWIERRMRGIKAATQEFPEASLTLRYGLSVNFPNDWPCEGQPSALDIVNSLSGVDKPHYLMLSYWNVEHEITYYLDIIEDTTKYPRARILVSELGQRVDNDQRQYLLDNVRAAWDWGVSVVNIWIWKEVWCGEKQNGLWYKQPDCQGRVEWTHPTPGYEALQELLMEEEDD